MTRSRALSAGDVFRARLILLLAEGLPYLTVEKRLDTTAPTIARWKNISCEIACPVWWKPGTPDKNPLSSHRRCKPRSWRPRVVNRTTVPPTGRVETGQTSENQQRYRPPDLANGRVATAPLRALHGERRSRFRTQSDRGHWSVSASPAACGGVLRGRKNGHPSIGSVGSRLAHVPGTCRTARI